jgi:CRP-like cAMP-binding protein
VPYLARGGAYQLDAHATEHNGSRVLCGQRLACDNGHSNACLTTQRSGCGRRETGRAMKQQSSSLSSGDLVALGLKRLGSIRHEPAHTVLFERGDPPQGVYLVISGKVELSLGTTVSRLLNRILGPGEIAGLPAAVSGEPYSLNATTRVACELLYVPRETIGAVATSRQYVTLEVGKTLHIVFSLQYERIRASAVVVTQIPEYWQWNRLHRHGPERSNQTPQVHRGE